MHCVLMYHTFGGHPTPGADPLYCIKSDLFRKHLIHLITAGAEVVDVGSSVHGEFGRGDRVSLTIDDGDRSILTDALPLLEEYGLSATVYLATGLVGTPGFLSWPEVRECRRRGLSFQSHTHTHPCLDRLSGVRIRDELERSRLLLEDALGEPVQGLALPGGSGELAVIRKIAGEVGYRYVATSRWGYNQSPDFFVERISWMRTQSFRLFQDFVAGDSGALRRMQWRAEVIKTAKRCLGPDLYGKLKRTCQLIGRSGG